MAGPAQALDLNGSLAVLQALLNTAAGVPGATAQYELGPWAFPQVGGDGIALLPNGQAGTNELTKLSYDIISIVGIGCDEQRIEYHPEILPPDDEYIAPGETVPTLGSSITKSCGNRTIKIQVKAETHAPSAAGAWLYIERIRTKLGLPLFIETLEAAGFAIANYTDARPTNYKDASGRTVNVVYLELEINAADSASDDPTTTIEQTEFAPFGGGSAGTPIVCTLIYPLAAQAAMVGVPLVISGTISRPGAVAIEGIGGATIQGLSWFYVYTPVVGDVGPRVFTVTATDNFQATSTVSVTVTVAAAAALPGGITPLAWFRRDALAFQDLAGTVPAVAPGAPVRRVNNVSPLAGYWQSQAGSARKDPAGARLEPLPTGQYPLQFLSGGVATSITINDCIFAVSWVQRWIEWSLILAASPVWSATPTAIGAGSAGTLGTGFASVPGARHSLVVRWTPTGIKAKLKINGVVTGNATVAATINAANPNSNELRVGHFQSYAYGSVVEMVVANGAGSDAAADALLDYVDSIPAAPAYPLDRPLLAFAGDSNTVGVSVDHYNTFKFYALRALRAAYDPEMACVAVGGSGIGGQSALVAPLYDSRRAKNVCVYLSGTNEFATGQTSATKLPVYLAECDAMRAQGWLVVVGTIQDRNGSFAGGATHASYETERAAFKAGLLANASHYDGIVDIAAIAGLGTFGDADGANFNVDHVHFSTAGYALLNPVVTAVIQALLQE